MRNLTKLSVALASILMLTASCGSGQKGKQTTDNDSLKLEESTVRGATDDVTQQNAQGASNNDYNDPNRIAKLIEWSETIYRATQLPDTTFNDYNEEVEYYKRYIKNEGSDKTVLWPIVHLGTMYFTGKGVKQNFYVGALWYLKAAAKNDPDEYASLLAGYILSHGLFVDKDLEKAKDLLVPKRYDITVGSAVKAVLLDSPYKEEAMKYLNAAEQGDTEAQYQITQCYMEGSGVEENHNEAEKWCMKAAENGNTKAQYMAYVLCRYDDYYNRAKWLKKAADKGSKDAIFEIEIRKAFAEEGDEDSKKVLEELNKLQ